MLLCVSCCHSPPLTPRADPVVCVPSSFFIGDNGIPLEVIAGSVSVEELVTRIHKVKQVMLTGWTFQVELVMLSSVMALDLSLCLWKLLVEVEPVSYWFCPSNNKICNLGFSTQLGSTVHMCCINFCLVQITSVNKPTVLEKCVKSSKLE